MARWVMTRCITMDDFRSMLTCLLMVLDNIRLITQCTNTLYETVLANPDFTWERANNYNLGLDATILIIR